VRRPLHVEISDLARAQIRAAQDWWRANRPKAPNAIREELERASLLISVQPEIGARARQPRQKAHDDEPRHVSKDVAAMSVSIRPRRTANAGGSNLLVAQEQRVHCVWLLNRGAHLAAGLLRRHGG
jgi:hypothetical protein